MGGTGIASVDKHTEVTTENLTRIACWALEFVAQHGKVMSKIVHNWHTETTAEASCLNGFRIRTYGSFSMYGGDNVMIWFQTAEGKETKVLDVNLYALGELRTHTAENLPEWQPQLEPLISEWELKKHQAKVKRQREAAQIRRQRPRASETIGRHPHVKGVIFAQPKDWEADLKRCQDIGLLPKNETWNGATISITLNTGEKLFVNERHPDFPKWKELRLSDEPPLSLKDRPSRFILPAWARYLSFEAKKE